MPGDNRVRHCATCDHDVHDLSAMRPEEAEALLHTGPRCVRFELRVPHWPSIDANRLSRARRIAVAMSASLAVAACSPEEEATTTVPHGSTAPLSVDGDAVAPPFVDSGIEQLLDTGASDEARRVRAAPKRTNRPPVYVMGTRHDPHVRIATTME